MILNSKNIISGKNLASVSSLVELAMKRHNPSWGVATYTQDTKSLLIIPKKPFLSIRFNIENQNFEDVQRFFKKLGSARVQKTKMFVDVELETVDLEALQPPPLSEEKRKDIVDTLNKLCDKMESLADYYLQDIRLDGVARSAYEVHFAPLPHPIFHIAKKIRAAKEIPGYMPRLDVQLLQQWFHGSKESFHFQWGGAEEFKALQTKLSDLRSFFQPGESQSSHVERAKETSGINAEFLKFTYKFLLNVCGNVLRNTKSLPKGSEHLRSAPSDFKKLLEAHEQDLDLAVSYYEYDAYMRSRGQAR